MPNHRFNGEVYQSPIAYQFPERVLNVQASALNNLYAPSTLQRMQNCVARVADNDPKYTMYDMFTDVRRAIWGEMTAPSNVTSLRRQLQIAHLRRIVAMYLSTGSTFPTDAITLAANDLEVLDQAARGAANSGAIDAMSKAHYKEVVRQIAAAREARLDYQRYLPGN